MSGSWNDFNDARSNTNLIPKGTLARVRMTLRPGGFNDPSQGWTGGYATRGSTGAVYLNAEFTVVEGPFARRKIFSLIGLHSPKGPDWGNMGRTFLRGLLNSARGLSDKDSTPEAQNARKIVSFAELDGIEFVAKIEVGTDTNGEDKNEIRSAVTRDHKDYAALMGGTPGYAAGQQQLPVYAQPAAAPTVQQAPQPQPTAYSPPAAAAIAPAAGVRPTWAR